MFANENIHVYLNFPPRDENVMQCIFSDLHLILIKYPESSQLTFFNYNRKIFRYSVAFQSEQPVGQTLHGRI